MALRFVDGFDHYSLPAQLNMKYHTLSIDDATFMAGRRAGSQALLFRSAEWIAVTLDNQTTWIVGLAVYFVGNGSDALIRFYNTEGDVQASVVVQTNGTIRLYRGTTSTSLAISDLALNLNTWYYIEAKINIADSGGLFEVRVNEQVWVTYTGDTKQASVGGASRVILYGRSADNAIDDLYICDGTGSSNNDYLGDCRVDTIYPNGTGAHSDFTPQGSGANWENVDETLMDEDSSYNHSNTIGHKDSFAFTNLPAITGTIFGVQACFGARKDDAGVRVVRPLTRIDGTDYEGGDQYLASSFLFARNIWEQNPDTSSAWVQADIDDAEFGYKIQS